MDTHEYRIQQGLPERFRPEAARLYDQAFGRKFSVAVPSEQKRLALLEDCITKEYSITASSDERLIGVAGFQTPNGSFTGGMTFSLLVSRLGWFKGLWAAWIFSLYERRPKPGELLMDGIAVHRQFRGQGIGSRLLDEIVRYGKRNGYSSIRLDVIDTNPRAKALYERKRFRATRTETFPYLRWLLGFGGSTRMSLDIRPGSTEG